MSKLGECRRTSAILGILLLLLSIFGNEFPWLSITENDEVHSWYFVNSGEFSDIQADQDIKIANYYLDIYMNLFNVQACLRFISGILPPSSGSTNLENNVMCLNYSYKNINNIIFYNKKWDNYTKKCSQTGLICASLIFSSIILFILINIIVTFKSKNNQRCKGCLCGISIFVPLFIFMGILIYFVGCMEADTKQILSEFSRSKKSRNGMFIAIFGGLLIIIWWLLFICSIFKKPSHISDNKFNFKQKLKIPDESDAEDDDIDMSIEKSLSLKPTKRKDIENGEEIKSLNKDKHIEMNINSLNLNSQSLTDIDSKVGAYDDNDNAWHD